jgi:hypothetical protein
MSIFALLILGALCGGAAMIVPFWLMWDIFDSRGFKDSTVVRTGVITGVVVCLAFIFGVLGLTTESAETWTASYEAQKATIEASVESENLSGLEKFELVKQASELNKELAERKAKADRWHWVYYGGNPYADCELIRL